MNPSNQSTDAAKIKSVKTEIERLVLEALYLGVTVEELIQLINHLDASKGGGDSHD